MGSIGYCSFRVFWFLILVLTEILKMLSPALHGETCSVALCFWISFYAFSPSPFEPLASPVRRDKLQQVVGQVFWQSGQTWGF